MNQENRSMRRKAFHTVAAVLLSCTSVLTACTMTPDYERPQVTIPEEWRETKVQQSSSETAYEWWQSFDCEELNGFMAQALENNSDLKAGIYQIEQARAALKIAGADLLPSVDGSTGTSRRYTNPASGKTTNATGLNAGLDVSYELDLFGKNSAGLAGAEADLTASQFDQDALALVVMGDVAETYFTILNLRERLAIADSNLENAREVLRIIEARVNEGAESELELSQQKSSVATNEASRTSLALQLRNAENAMSILLGKTPQDLGIKGMSLKEVIIPEIAALQPSDLLERRPDLRSAEASLISANADIGAAKAAFYPSISLGLGDTISTTGFGDPTSTVLSLASSLSVPIFKGGSLQGGLDKATARQMELSENYRGSVLSAFQEAEDALASVKSSELREKSLETAMLQARKAYKISKDKYDAGSIDFQTLLDTQSSLFDADDSFSQARLSRLTAAIDLYSAMGGGWYSE